MNRLSVNKHAPACAARARSAARARDRVLQYTRGMDLPPVLGLELALQSMRNAGLADERTEQTPEAAIANIMHEFHSLLHTNAITFRLADKEGHPLRSTPPMNRRHMIAEELDRYPLRTTLIKWLRTLAKTLKTYLNNKA